ncbi:MAG: tRNA/rRNA methyltransferase (SpoU) [Parcubacteria group bacterium GW2011_GWA2_45_30]|nr:MAG: tRNA/rRNA methyltransferase (SpoU) [Parcubacteria group bacterium GW2011_GWA2_45_30]
MRRISYAKYRILHYIQNDHDVLIAVLHNIRSIHNVGSIFRTADAAGIKKIYLCGFTPGPVDELGKTRRPFIKVSLGAEKYMAWEKARSTVRILKKLKKDGYQIFAIEQSKNSVPYYRIKPKHKQKIALVVGHEVKGISPKILSLVDKILEIPMRGKKESLNVAAAFGIITFHLIHR